MNKYISKIVFGVFLALGLAACSSDDIVGEQEMKAGHDEKGNYVPITIEAGYGEYQAIEEGSDVPASRVAPASAGGTGEIITEKAGNWAGSETLVVVFDGKISELPYKSKSTQQKASFSGRLYYSSSKIPTTSKLHVYVKSNYLEVNASNPTSYKMLNINTQTGTLSSAFERTVWYGAVTYSSITSGVTLKPQTAIINFRLRGPLQASGVSYTNATLKLEGKGWGNSETELVQFTNTIGNSAKQFCYCVNTKYTITAEKVVATYNKKIYERLIGDEKKQITFKAGAIYNKKGNHGNLDDSPTLRIGDFLYSDGGWGDDPTPESGHKIIGIVTSKNSNFASGNGQESYHGTAMAIVNANNNADTYFRTAASTTYNGRHTSFSAATTASGLTMTNQMLALSDKDNWLAAKAAREFSKLPVPEGCSEWYLPSAAEWAALLNGVGECGTYSYTLLSNGHPNWWQTEWYMDPAKCVAAINAKLTLAKSAAYITPINFAVTHNFWVADRSSNTADNNDRFLRCDFDNHTNKFDSSKKVIFIENANTVYGRVRPFIQF